MRLFFVLIFLIFSFLETQAQVLIPGPILQYDFNEFDWKSFSNQKNVQEFIDFKNEIIREFGANLIISYINIDKTDLTRIEQELFLYEEDLKGGLSKEEIKNAREAIQDHKKNISSIESSILEEFLKAGVMVDSTEVPKEQPAIETIKELYGADHGIVFHLVEKTDEKLYSAIGDDEKYAKLILPQVEQYIGQMGMVAQSYYDSFLSPSESKFLYDRDNMNDLTDMYSGSLGIYKCFLKNFKNPVGESQEKLKQTIESWYEWQSELSATALIEAYRQQTKGELSPWYIVGELNRFEMETPEDVKYMIADFYKNDIINNPEFIGTNEDYKLGARVDALIGLEYLGVLEEERYEAERELFERAMGAGVIEPIGENYYSGSIRRPLP